MNKPNLAVEFAGIKMKNPVMTASGTCGYGRELNRIFPLERLGGISVKGTTLEPRLGNNMPRIAETPAGLLNCVGLQNPGAVKVTQKELPWVVQHDLAVIVNIAGGAVEDYGKVAAMVSNVQGVAALEVNISCPNVSAGGMAHGAKPETAAAVVKEVRQNTNLPMIVKLSPNVTNIVEIAKAVEKAGADAVSLINTLLGMEIDIESRSPLLGNKVGGLSGPAVHPVAVRMVWQVAQAVKIPIIGMGGIMTAEDALQFMMAGATAIAIGSGTMVDPMTPIKVIEGLEEWLIKEGIADIKQIIGAALPGKL
ncbi:MAG: dihydroorotate dehydrogenase [Clostridia bacterium]|nr:dihydroorotate dehydrogenase [Clostridia bacterium]MDD4571733.1 dihydroorotate dehydrogenase [Clostridia bacterium]